MTEIFVGSGDADRSSSTAGASRDAHQARRVIDTAGDAGRASGATGMARDAGRASEAARAATPRDAIFANSLVVTLDQAAELPFAAQAVARIREAQARGSVSENVAVFPGFCDVHVHLREPGQSAKETIATGTRAAARGGFTTVCAMPNLDPVPDTLENLALEEALIARDAVIETLPYASATTTQAGAAITPIGELAQRAIGFSDDGHGLDDPDLMEAALREIAKAGSIIAIHAEDGALRPAGSSINAGPLAEKLGLIGIPKEAEYAQIARDLEILRRLAAENIFPAYHVCHVSCPESVELLTAAKAEGLNVSCETAPHYLLLDESQIPGDNGHFKMNPPLRKPSDREAIANALAAGTIDFIATDHAPHTAEEKARGLAGSAFGIVGIETSFALIDTHFVETGGITLERAVELFTTAPRARFNIPARAGDLTIWDLGADATIDPADFASKGRATPFAGWKVRARCLATFAAGREVYTGVGSPAEPGRK
ncbi:dihydroorotase [Arcanobacterium wilhelmae]|uniref:Dihydroorotase n=1 Tax=Arcanobacterium wilhelmae TaxID=1803177 RepID=A0ABT9NAH0_9ACTO|nr:dihydroorotase [Arcanobacterium wilhelmae]MDP9800720.1 dihydroorotase [Arcanobacterium wilhelmae]WFN90119.1 dihydroorotase [Arcanobacterium wilhelmae]